MTVDEAAGIDRLLALAIARIPPGGFINPSTIADEALTLNDPERKYALGVRLAALDFFQTRAAELINEPAALAAVAERLDDADETDLASALLSAVASRRRFDS